MSDLDQILVGHTWGIRPDNAAWPVLQGRGGRALPHGQGCISLEICSLHFCSQFLRLFSIKLQMSWQTGYLLGNRIVEIKTIKSSSKFCRFYFDGSAQEKIGGGWFLEQAWARKENLSMWAPAMKVAINISKETLPAYDIFADLIYDALASCWCRHCLSICHAG